MDRSFKHSRGPWVIKPEEVGKDYIRIRGDVAGSRFKIANVLTPTYDGVHEREAEETRANARLIAAAPELLAVLVEMLGCRAMDPALFPCDEADAIIAKVRGV